MPNATAVVARSRTVIAAVGTFLWNLPRNILILLLMAYPRWFLPCTVPSAVFFLPARRMPLKRSPSTVPSREPGSPPGGWATATHGTPAEWTTSPPAAGNGRQA